MTRLSVVVPCYNEQDAVSEFYKELKSVLEQMDLCHEVLFVDDGSTDTTIAKLDKLADEDERVSYVSFSRNFGKEAAIFAGLEHATGDFIVVMDADLQHPPSLLPQMYTSLMEEDWDMCRTRRITRNGEPIIRSFFARQFYKFIRKMADIDLVDGAQDFCMMTRQVADSILQLKEINRFTKGIYGWIGFKTKWIEQENVERKLGETKWTFWGLLKYSMAAIIGFSTTPLIISSIFGILFCFIAVLLIIFVCIKTIFFGEPVAGYPTIMCTISLIGGIQLLCIGLLGQYFAKAYIEIKKRPIYLIRKKR